MRRSLLLTNYQISLDLFARSQLQTSLLNINLDHLARPSHLCGLAGDAQRGRVQGSEAQELGPKIGTVLEQPVGAVGLGRRDESVVHQEVIFAVKFHGADRERPDQLSVKAQRLQYSHTVGPDVDGRADLVGCTASFVDRDFVMLAQHTGRQQAGEACADDREFEWLGLLLHCCFGFCAGTRSSVSKELAGS